MRATPDHGFQETAVLGRLGKAQKKGIFFKLIELDHSYGSEVPLLDFVTGSS